jgi:nitrite reductase/ring-hydroxylating ferredoxin subunit
MTMPHDKRDEVWKLRPNAPVSGYVLGRADAIGDNSAHEFIVGEGRSAFRMFVIHRHGRFSAYLNLCPHYSLPLNHKPHQFLNDGYIECAQHFARFNVDDGHCVSGACEGEHLTPIPVMVNVHGLLAIA